MSDSEKPSDPPSDEQPKTLRSTPTRTWDHSSTRHEPTSRLNKVSSQSSRSDSGSQPSSKNWTVLELLRWTTQYFQDCGIESPRLDAECLLAYALQCDRLRVYLDFEKPVMEAERARFRELVQRRARERVPVSLLMGQKEFWSLSLRVTPAVLTPRPDTETLVMEALDFLRDRDRPYRVLDLGTGSGAVALAIASERPRVQITATDISLAALEVARTNAQTLGLSERMRFLESDWFSALSGEVFDLIVSNPPYLAESEAATLAPELAHEPRKALFAGTTGFEALQKIAVEAPKYLVAGGEIALEFAPEQARSMQEFLQETGFVNVRILKDLAGRARVVAARNPESV